MACLRSGDADQGIAAGPCEVRKACRRAMPAQAAAAAQQPAHFFLGAFSGGGI
jgi:hypothetical protein